ncbi:MAG: putative polymerase, sigma 28 subunit, FliA/WhiG subfamily [Firmicutes bacterium]|nr:putative polymerase, sigma 28 subunit, FliA/WhiG subfamily [Bacillota bacterium]
MVIEAQKGNAVAFEVICKQFTGLVKKSAYQAHIRPICEEAVSVGYLALVEAIKTFDRSLEIKFAGYAQSKIKFAIWNLFKKERSRWQNEFTLEAELGEGSTVLDTLADDMNIEKQIELKILSNDLLHCMEKLPAKQRQVILLTIVSGKSLTETASLLGVTPQAIYSLKNRGIKQMQALYKEGGY